MLPRKHPTASATPSTTTAWDWVNRWTATLTWETAPPGPIRPPWQPTGTLGQDPGTGRSLALCSAGCPPPVSAAPLPRFPF